MHILMISDVYFPRINGVSTSIKSFRDKLMEFGHKVTLVVPDYPVTTSADYPDDEDIIRIDSRRVILDPEDRMFKYGKVRSKLEYFKQQGYDIIHIHTPFVAHYAGVKLAKNMGIPCVETYHTYFEEYLYHYIPYAPRSWMRGLARFFTRSQCNNVNAVIVPSTAMKKALDDYRVETEKVILPTGIKMDDFSDGDGNLFREKYKIEETRPVLTHIGRVAHEKNIGFLINMLNRLRASVPDILLVITGEGPAVPALKKLVRKLELDKHVLFIGYLSREKELLDCYKAGDIFVFASHTETQGLVLLESMACGTPVVSLAKMGTVDILSPRKGAVIAENNYTNFAARVLNLLENASLRLRMGEDAIAYASTWSVDNMTNKLLSFYANVINGYDPSTRNKYVEAKQNS